MSKLLQDPLNIVIAGIGGQGNILASEMLGSALVEKGFRVAVGETYGASQRGGSVMSHLRVSASGEMGVLIGAGRAQIIVGFEPLETLRMARDYANKQTIIIYDNRPAYPLSVLIGEETYPDLAEMQAELQKICRAAYVVEAANLAQQADNPKGANIALMGALAALPQMPLEPEEYLQTLSQRFEGALLELNRKVFELGYQSLQQQLKGDEC